MTYPFVLALKIPCELLSPLFFAIFIFEVDGNYVVPHLLITTIKKGTIYQYSLTEMYCEHMSICLVLFTKYNKTAHFHLRCDLNLKQGCHGRVEQTMSEGMTDPVSHNVYCLRDEVFCILLLCVPFLNLLKNNYNQAK